MGLFNLFKKEETASLPYEKDAVFEHILNIFFDFKDKYPDKIVSLGIYPSEKFVGDVAFDICFIFDGNIKYYTSNETNEMLEFYQIVEDDGTFMTFQCTHNTFENAKSLEYTIKKLKAYVQSFMNAHPSRKFDFSSHGAVIRFW